MCEGATQPPHKDGVEGRADWSQRLDQVKPGGREASGARQKGYLHPLPSPKQINKDINMKIKRQT